MASTVNSLGVAIIVGIFSVVFSLLAICFIFVQFRKAHKKEALKGIKAAAPLIFHSPDDTPRSFMQYPYRRSLIGDVLLWLWVVIFFLGYLWMVVFCWFVYPVGSANSLGAPPEVKEAFGGWSGLVAPWLFIYTCVHLLWLMIIQVWDAMRTQFMMPVATFAEATHVVIEEDLDFMTDDQLPDPDMGAFMIAMKRHMSYFQRKFKRASARTVLTITEDDEGTRQIEYTCVRYAYSDEDGGSFKPQGLAEYTPRQAHAILRAGGLSEKAAAQTFSACGRNEINVYVPTVIEALITEFWDFTKVVASMGTWAYMVYSAANLGMVWFMITFAAGAYKALCITRPSQQENARLAQLDAHCEVQRGGTWMTIPANEIVLGDIIRVDDRDEPKLPCDGIVIEGSIVTNESMLTGEPMPVQKMPAEDSDLSTVTKRNVAYAGTKCLQSTGPSEGKAIMIAFAVGALTTRGQLVRMVLFPTSVRFKYIDQLPTVYCCLFVYMVILLAIYILFVDVGGWVATYLLCINTCAMCLNPMLPVSMVMGQTAAAHRLKKELEINCLQPGRIAIAGKISTMVFDKTGTITKEGMDFSAVLPVQGSNFTQQVTFDDDDPENPENRRRIATEVPQQLRHALTSCHTVAKMNDGMLIGNAVEVSMVRTCGWDLGDPFIKSPDGTETLEVVKKLDFDHKRMTSGVVVRSQQSGQMEVYIKGSYERIRQLAQKDSVPTDYDSRTTAYAKEGYYTLGIASKTLPQGTTKQSLTDMPRDNLESDIRVCGLLLFINEMKPDSDTAIRELEKGSVRSVICTGDNALTGISIGKKCGIVKTETCLLGDMESSELVWRDPSDNKQVHEPEHFELAVTQSAWRHLHSNPEELESMWTRILVFARMKPDDKINVVKYLQSHGLVVGMSGDGGNDCGGLRAAHAGLALSDAEASMVSPFSSGRDGKSLMTVVDMLREGRACLATNIATFQFFMVYGFVLTIIRTWLVLYASLSLGEFVWLTNDIIFGILMVSLMVRSKPTAELCSYRPTASLLGTRTITAIAFPVFSCVIMQVVAYGLLWSSDFYIYVNPLYDLHLPGEDWMLKGDNYDSAIGAFFLFTTLSTVAFVNTYGGSFRLNICWNYLIMIVYAVVIFALGWMLFAPASQFGCLYRVNCDTEQSLASRDLTIFAVFSRLGGAGLVGGCFLGPQLKDWQKQLDEEGWEGPNGEEFWLPRPEPGHCLPPEGKAVTPPYDAVENGVGPNNVFPGDFKWQLFIVLAAFVVMNHLFVKVVLQGPVAAYLRREQKRKDRQLLCSDDVDYDETTDEDGTETDDVASQNGYHYR